MRQIHLMQASDFVAKGYIPRSLIVIRLARGHVPDRSSVDKARHGLLCSGNFRDGEMQLADSAERGLPSISLPYERDEDL